MTMRLDIVTNDAGELVRREHARDLGAGVVVAIYRLVKLAQLHDLGNQAFLRQLEQTHQIIGEYCLRSGSNVSVLFAHKATFVAGQLLKGSRAAYEMAAEVGSLLERIGGSELHISRDITREDCLAFAEQISMFHRTGNAAGVRLPPKIHLRQVADAARLRGIELEHLTPDQRIVRAYASAVVIMRRFFEDLTSSRYVLPRRIKRIAQSLVDLSDAQAASFLGVTEVRNANFDEAGRAVNTAILAVSIARETIQDRGILSVIAMAAMMHDVARPRALALAGAGGSPMPGMAGPSSLSEDQEDRLAAGAAAVLTALGRVNEPSIRRTVLTFEALWLRRKTWLGPVYWGARSPTMHASIIAIARRYNDLLTPEPGLPPPTTDFVIATLASELTDPQDRTVLRMLVSALGLLPTGTIVQLSTGEVAEVTHGTKSLGDKPRVMILADPSGAQYPQPVEIDLAADPRRTVIRVLSVDGWRKGLQQDEMMGAGPDSDEDVIVSDPPPPPQATAPPLMPASISPLAPNLSASSSRSADRQPAWGADGERESDVSGASGEHPASASLPSLGSSPSAVAEAMGRMINDSLAPPAIPPRETVDRPDRTVFQPNGPNDVEARPMLSAEAREPTARGNLAATPLPHVLVYMLDHALTGSVVFEGTNTTGQGMDDTIYFVRGVPAKIRLSDSVALLGEVLVEDGSLDAQLVDQAVEGASHLGILLGEFLVGHDMVSREALAWALEGQLLRKIGHVANLAPEIQYSYFRDVDLLEGWGGEVVVTHPLNPILASVRHWNDRARVRATLNRIGKHQLALHPDSDLTNIAVLSEEQKVLDAIRAEAMMLASLFKLGLADEEVVSSLVYSLAVTRQFAFKGQKKGPMAARGAAWRSVNPPSSASKLPASSSGPSVAPKSASGSRPAAAAPPHRVAATAGAPPPPNPPRMGSSPRVQPSTQLRAAAPSSTSRLPVSPPAARPPGRPTPPQIRPITTKKPTMVGMQPASPPEVRAPASVRNPPTNTPSSPPDDAKTIALASPAMKDLLAKRGPLPGARPPAPKPALPSSPTQPSKAQGVPAGAKSSGLHLPPKGPPRAGVPGAGPRNPVPMASSTLKGVAPAPSADDPFEEETGLNEVPIELHDGPVGGSQTGSVIEIGEGGLADAEAALEAMQSFRLAEAALQRNDTVKAEELARKAVAGDPSQPDYLSLLAWIKSLVNTPQALDEAIRTMSKVLIEDPSNERALFYRGKLLVRMNRLPEALHDFSELLSANPHHREAQNEARILRAKLPS